MIDEAVDVKISVDSMHEIGKIMVLRTYNNVSEYQRTYEAKGVDNLTPYDLNDYEYNKSLLEALKVVIRYVTLEDERPEGV